MSVRAYLAQIGSVAGVDLDGLPEYMPGTATDAGTLNGSHYSVEIPLSILDFVESTAGRKAERARYSPSELFCPGRMARIALPIGGACVLVDLSEGWGNQLLGVPVKIIDQKEYEAVIRRWESFFAACEVRKNARWEEPVVLRPIDNVRWLAEGKCYFTPPGDETDAMLFAVQGRWLYGVVDRRGKQWHLTDARALSMELALKHGVLDDPDAKEVISRQVFVDVAREHGVHEALFDLHRRTLTLPDLKDLARETILTGASPAVELPGILTAMKEKLPPTTPAFSGTPAEKEIVQAARTAVAELERAIAVVEGVRVARQHYGIDIAGERPAALADLDVRIAEANARRDALVADLKSLGGEKGRQAQALTRAEEELAALETRRKAFLVTVTEAEREAKVGIERARASVDAAVAKVAQEVQQRVAGLDVRRAQLAAEVTELAARVGAVPAADHCFAEETTPAAELSDPASLARALEAQGLRYTPAWPTRFLVAALAARRVGALMLLAGPTGTGKTRLVRHIAGLLDGSGHRTIPVRPEWLAASDLLGYVDPIRDSFAPTDFVATVRDATVADLARAASGPAMTAAVPWFLLLDELNLARVENFGADLLSALDARAGDPSRALRLFPQDVRDGWLHEWSSLRERPNLDARESWRADLLRRMFDPTTHRQIGATDAHLLALPLNLVVCGTLNTDRHTHELSPKVFDRSFVLQIPAPSVDEVLQRGVAPPGDDTSLTQRFVLPSAPAGYTAQKPEQEVINGFRRAIQALRPAGLVPSFRLARNAHAYLLEAAAWPDLAGDTGRMLGDLVHLLLLPRLDCSADAARQALQALTEVVRPWCNADLDRELQELRARADDARHGDFRGLA